MLYLPCGMVCDIVYKYDNRHESCSLLRVCRRHGGKKHCARRLQEERGRSKVLIKRFMCLKLELVPILQEHGHFAHYCHHCRIVVASFFALQSYPQTGKHLSR